jgi:hypothetical protein
MKPIAVFLATPGPITRGVGGRERVSRRRRSVGAGMLKQSSNGIMIISRLPTVLDFELECAVHLRLIN